MSKYYPKPNPFILVILYYSQATYPVELKITSIKTAQMFINLLIFTNKTY